MQPEPEGERRSPQGPKGRGAAALMQREPGLLNMYDDPSYWLSKFHSGRLPLGNLKNPDWCLDIYSPPPESKLLKKLEKNEKKSLMVYKTGYVFQCVFTDICGPLLGCKIYHAFYRLDGKTKRYSYTYTVHY